MVGNGATNWNVDVGGSFPSTVAWFNIIPPRMLEKFEKNECHYYFYPEFDTQRQSAVCDLLWADINRLAENLNWYDLYRPVYPESMLATSKALKSSNRYATAMIDGKP
jgi:hypothetical protein